MFSRIFKIFQLQSDLGHSSTDQSLLHIIINMHVHLKNNNTQYLIIMNDNINCSRELPLQSFVHY